MQVPWVWWVLCPLSTSWQAEQVLRRGRATTRTGRADRAGEPDGVAVLLQHVQGLNNGFDLGEPASRLVGKGTVQVTDLPGINLLLVGGVSGPNEGQHLTGAGQAGSLPIEANATLAWSVKKSP